MSIYKVCDYITLNISSADNIDKYTAADNALYTWTIPESAYRSTRRGQVCAVEVVSGVFSKKIQGAATIYAMNIEYVNGAYNSTCSSKGSPVIAHCSTTRQFAYRCHSTGQILCSDRPHHITLGFHSFTNEPTKVGTDKNPFLLAPKLTGSITLKYSYYDVEQTNEYLKSEFNTQF